MNLNLHFRGINAESFRATLLVLLIVLVSSCESDDSQINPVFETGTIQVNVTTSGVELDSDGYVIYLDGTPKPVGVDGTVQFDSVELGWHYVSVTGARLNCDAEQGREQMAHSSFGRITNVNFDVICTTKPIVFRATRGYGERDIYRMNLDGSGQVKITENGSGWGPRWSPDGMRISYLGPDDNIFIMDEDGSNKTLVLEISGTASPAAWSPDGTKLVTINEGDIYSVNTDGTEATKLTNFGDDVVVADPDWGPASDPRIVFTYWRANGPDREEQGIFIMNDNGSSITRLTTGDDHQPAWSKDGTKIAFTRHGEEVAIFILDLSSGTITKRGYSNGTWEMMPRWSPDDLELTFSAIFDETDVFIGYSLESSSVNLTQCVDVSEAESDWRPDI
ncbi:MAG: hypothetical protein DHS20C17_05310 [Cyclobacteriaceae bacterium]|nr:MAG: hypothetical protein DHS20C17_05310 [Cyclobacteriaceae bacterium]